MGRKSKQIQGIGEKGQQFLNEIRALAKNSIIHQALSDYATLKTKHNAVNADAVLSVAYELQKDCEYVNTSKYLTEKQMDQLSYNNRVEGLITTLNHIKNNYAELYATI